MQENNLTQKDLNILGSQGVVSEILNGKRDLNVRQIKLLADKFKISPSVFI
jgi:HTH-type transcriptional regulator/antitoxin HigA